MESIDPRRFGIKPILRTVLIGSTLCVLAAVAGGGAALADDGRIVRTFQTWCIVDDEWKEGTADTVSPVVMEEERERCVGVARKILADFKALPGEKRFQFLMNACMAAPGSYSAGEKILDEMRRAEGGAVRDKRDHCRDHAERLIATLN